MKKTLCIISFVLTLLVVLGACTTEYIPVEAQRTDIAAAPSETSGNTEPLEKAEAAPEEVMEKVSEETPGEASEEAPEETPGEASEEAPEETPADAQTQPRALQTCFSGEVCCYEIPADWGVETQEDGNVYHGFADGFLKVESHQALSLAYDTVADAYAAQITDWLGRTPDTPASVTPILKKAGNMLGYLISYPTKVNGAEASGLSFFQYIDNAWYVFTYHDVDLTEEDTGLFFDILDGVQLANGVCTTPELTEPAETAAAVADTEPAGTSYVLNKNTKKFHHPSCSSAGDIKPENREDFTGSRDEVIARGFVPCKRCNP